MLRIFRSLTVGFVLVLLYVVGVADLVAQEVGTVKGAVIDGKTREPIPLVNIYLRGTNRGVATDENGTFQINIPAGKMQVIAFSHVAYKKEAYDAQVDAGEEMTVNIELEPDAVKMNEITVTAQKPSNEITANYVISEKQIESVSAYNVRDILRWFSPQVFYSQSALAAFRRQSGFTLFVDNMRWEPVFIDALDPYSIKKILVWRSGWAPMYLRMEYGNRYLVQVITK